MSENYDLPDGTWTDDANEMAAAWHGFSSPIAEAMGMSLYGFGHGITLVDRGGETFHFPNWVARRLNEALAGSPWGDWDR